MKRVKSHAGWMTLLFALDLRSRLSATPTALPLAVPRPSKPNPGWRSVATTDILVWKGKYYLYYQAFMEASGTRGDFCPVAVSSADSPDGPWIPHNKVVIPNGAAGDHFGASVTAGPYGYYLIGAPLTDGNGGSRHGVFHAWDD